MMNPQDRTPAGPVGEDRRDVPADDRIIGVAFRRSLVVIVLLALAGALIWWLLERTPAPEAVKESELRAPASTSPEDAVELPIIPFRDITAVAGITFTHENGAEGERLLPETMGGGVAFFDFDGDGHADLLFVNSSSWPWSTGNQDSATAALYRNRGDGSFDDVTAGSGLDSPMYGMGAAVGDYDDDDRVDVFMTAVGENRLFRNLGEGRFEDVTTDAGVGGDPARWSTSAAFFDFDRDGDLDLYVANYVEWSRELDFEVDYRLAGIGRAYGPPTNFPGTHGYLYRNDEGRFTDVSAEAGVQVNNPATGLPAGKALAVLVDDLDTDGWPDLVVANDTVRNFFFHNQEGRFEEVGVASGLAFDNSGSATGAMGIDGARYADGAETAIAIGNFANEMSSFYVAPDRSALFTDEAIIAGIGPASRSALSFGLFFFDADLDGRLDLLQANGHVESDINIVQPSQHHAQPAQLFWHCGADCRRRFVVLPPEAVGDLYRPIVGRGAAYADIDSDGDLDVVLTQTGGSPRLLRNDQAGDSHWLRLRLRGSAPNSDAIGARVRLYANGRVQERQVSPTRSYLSQVELPLTFGLGDDPQISHAEVFWPDGTMEIFRDIAIDRMTTLEKGGGETS